MDFAVSIAARLLTAAVLGGLIGLEREIMNRAAGLRTHIMVSVGAALFTILSIYCFDHGTSPRDPARVAAQIVSGIGFLGAGAIMKHGSSVRGLTTAATLWVVAAIGMGCGAGAYEISALACVISLITLVALRRLEALSTGSNAIYLSVILPNNPGILESMRSALTTNDIQIKKLEISIEDEEVEARAAVTVSRNISRADIAAKLTELGAVRINMED